MIRPDQPLDPQRRIARRVAPWWCAPTGLLCWALAAVCYPLMGLPAGTLHTIATWLLVGFFAAGTALVAPSLIDVVRRVVARRPPVAVPAPRSATSRPAVSRAVALSAARSRAVCPHVSVVHASSAAPLLASPGAGRRTPPGQARPHWESLGGFQSRESAPAPLVGSLVDPRCGQPGGKQRYDTQHAGQQRNSRLRCDSKAQFAIRTGPAARERRTAWVAHGGVQRPTSTG